MKNSADLGGFLHLLSHHCVLTTALYVLPLLLISHWFECEAFGFQPLNNLVAALLKEVVVICDVNNIVGETLKGLYI